MSLRGFPQNHAIGGGEGAWQGKGRGRGRGVAGEGAWQGYVAAHAEEREGQARANDES